MKNPFTFIKGLLGYIDGGSFFRNPLKWLYAIFAILNFLVPIFILYQIIDRHVLSMLSGWQVVVLILGWLTMTAGFIMLGMLWWVRKGQIDTDKVENNEFPVTPVFADLFRTIGEWFGLLVGGVVFCTSLVMFIFSGFQGGMASMMMQYANSNLVSIILLPITGFLIIMVTRFLSEQIRVLVAIARNTKK